MAKVPHRQLRRTRQRARGGKAGAGMRPALGPVNTIDLTGGGLNAGDIAQMVLPMLAQAARGAARLRLPCGATVAVQAGPVTHGDSNTLTHETNEELILCPLAHGGMPGWGEGGISREPDAADTVDATAWGGGGGGEVEGGEGEGVSAEAEFVAEGVAPDGDVVWGFGWREGEGDEMVRGGEEVGQ